MSATFPDDQDDDANLVLTFGWYPEQTRGYQMRLLFDGSDVLAVADGEPVGRTAGTDRLAEIVESTYEDEDAWNQVLRDFISPAYNPVGFLREKNADTFFPFGRLRIDLARFLDQPVLLIQPDR